MTIHLTSDELRSRYPRQAAPWNRDSVVTACDECGGEGWVRSLRRPTAEDPYPETTCSACDGPQEPTCAVCGCTTVVPGYDCIVCQTVGELPTDMLTDKVLGDLIPAIVRAFNAAKSHGEAEARAAESYIPAGAV